MNLLGRKQKYIEQFCLAVLNINRFVINLFYISSYSNISGQIKAAPRVTKSGNYQTQVFTLILLFLNPVYSGSC